MKKASKDIVASNTQILLSALAEVLLEEEVSHGEFAELARFAFVQAAERILAGKKRITDSRVSILTGIHRKDVKRLRDDTDKLLSVDKTKSNRAIAVISAWTRESSYRDSSGNPLPLAYDSEVPSLSTLIQTYSGDMPVRAVCDELERMGVIEKKNSRWHLTVPVYIPNKSREELFTFLGEDTSNLIKTIRHNLNHPPRHRRFQRTVAYDELSPESAKLFQEFASGKAMGLLKEFDSWLSTREKQDKINRKKNSTLSSVKSGVGIYYFEELLIDESNGDS